MVEESNCGIPYFPGLIGWLSTCERASQDGALSPKWGWWLRKLWQWSLFSQLQTQPALISLFNFSQKWRLKGLWGKREISKDRTGLSSVPFQNGDALWSPKTKFGLSVSWWRLMHTTDLTRLMLVGYSWQVQCSRWSGCLKNGLLLTKGKSRDSFYCKLQVRNNRRLNIRRTWLSPKPHTFTLVKHGVLSEWNVKLLADHRE